MTIPLEEIVGMPAFSPYYPMPPARYRNVRLQYVLFRADVAAVDAVLPACFDPADDGECVVWGIDAPWTSNYGEFQAGVLSVKCRYGSETGYFVVVEYINSRGSIPAGREVYGTPKVWAQMRVAFDERVMHTDAMLAGASIFSIRSTMQHGCSAEDLPDLRRTWRLKVIPRADGTGAEIMQIIDGSGVVQDATVHVARTGDGVVEFRPSPVHDLSGFKPIEHLGAYYAEMDYTEGYGTVVQDFLEKD